MCADAVTEQDYAAVLIPPIQSVAPWHVKTVAALPGYRLAVGFNDGTEGVVELAELVASPGAGVFAALRDPAVFGQVYLQYGAVTWPGEIDLAPDAMHAAIKADGVWVLR
jgi:CubicO group peptidase (beta-lactamase class C family)